MPDITMCRGYWPPMKTQPTHIKVCPMSSDCWRCTADPNEAHQSWFGELPLTSTSPFHCDYFIPNGIKEASDRGCDCWYVTGLRHLEANGHLPTCNAKHQR